MLGSWLASRVCASLRREDLARVSGQVADQSEGCEGSGRLWDRGAPALLRRWRCHSGAFEPTLAAKGMTSPSKVTEPLSGRTVFGIGQSVELPAHGKWGAWRSNI